MCPENYNRFISQWFQETATDAAYVKRAFPEQKIALEELFESYEQGEINDRAFVREAERAAQTLNLLNQQTWTSSTTPLARQRKAWPV